MVDSAGSTALTPFHASIIHQAFPPTLTNTAIALYHLCNHNMPAPVPRPTAHTTATGGHPGNSHQSVTHPLTYQRQSPRLTRAPPPSIRPSQVLSRAQVLVLNAPELCTGSPDAGPPASDADSADLRAR